MQSYAKSGRALRLFRERQRLRIKRAWDSGTIHAKIALRDRAEDDFIRSKLDRKGSLVFVAALPCGERIRVEWSRAGRTDQFDLVDAADGRVSFTGRPELAMKELAARSLATT